MRIPVFVSHYNHHVEEHGDVAMLDFIVSHLDDDQLHHEGKHDDLPQHHHHSADCGSVQSFVLQPWTIDIACPQFSELNSTEPALYQSPSVPTAGTSSVWRPPCLS